MKQYISDRYWIQEHPDGKVSVGLTPYFLTNLGLIWAFIPREDKILVKDKPFANLESSKCLGPLRSPIDGELVTWNNKFLETPEIINSEQSLFIAKVK